MQQHSIAPCENFHAVPPGSWGSRIEDQQFAMMQTTFVESGGLLGVNEVARLLRRRAQKPLSEMACWIAERRIVNFVHRSRTWIPMFQFDPATMELLAEVRAAVGELTPAFDDWDLAAWFAAPNHWLHGAAPACVMASDPASVLSAARADRFIARG